MRLRPYRPRSSNNGRLCSILLSRGVHAVFKREILKNDTDIQSLDVHAQIGIIYLVVVSLTSFFSGAFFLSGLADGAHLAGVVLDGRAAKFLGQALIGFSGSAVAALISCLNRYATGFENARTTYPAAAKPESEKFSASFRYWLWAWPFLGAPVAPVFIWGLSHFTNDPQKFTTSNRLVGFTAFMAGLLAESVLELCQEPLYSSLGGSTRTCQEPLYSSQGGCTPWLILKLLRLKNGRSDLSRGESAFT
jgi:hypothetical protein